MCRRECARAVRQRATAGPSASAPRGRGTGAPARRCRPAGRGARTLMGGGRVAWWVRHACVNVFSAAMLSTWQAGGCVLQGPRYGLPHMCRCLLGLHTACTLGISHGRHVLLCVAASLARSRWLSVPQPDVMAMPVSQVQVGVHQPSHLSVQVPPQTENRGSVHGM